VASEVDPVDALDETFPQVLARVERGVVALEVDREDKPLRSLTQREKMGLGLGAMRIFDPRYFWRPSGPCTGVVVDLSPTGRARIVTSTWNVRDAKSPTAVHVVLPDGRRLPAVAKGRDENLDVVVIETRDDVRAEVTPLPAASTCSVGQFALLVGRGGDGGTPLLTVGHLSAVNRHKGDSIQVSARMNYGNVGGAIVGLDGRLLGIATRLTNRAHHGLNSGVGFAAPIQALRQELGDLASGKVVPRRKSPFLGISGDMNAPWSPDDEAALKDGDILKIFNGVELMDFMQLRDEIERLDVGDKVIVTAERDDKGEKDFTISLGARSEGEE
jgi:S1-C subfamily serine protease